MWKLDEPRMAVEPKSDPLRIEASSREGFWEVMADQGFIASNF